MHISRIERYKYKFWMPIVEDMSASVNTSFSFCFFPADGVLEASVRIGVDILPKIVIDEILQMRLSN